MIFTASATYLVVENDVIVHGHYIKLIIAGCYPSNQEKLCNDIRASEGVSTNAQMEIGNTYASWLSQMSVILGGMLMGFRLVLIYFATKLSPNLKWTGMRLYYAGLWGYTTISLFFFGWADAMYFWFQKITIPMSLPWLDHAGFLPYIAQYWHHTDITIADLYITMILGLVIDFFVWLPAILYYAKRNRYGNASVI